MEQDLVLRRHQPLRRFALLLAAHGERTAGADNESVERIAAALRARGVASEVGVGFIRGVPSIPDMVAELRAPEILVYPLLFAEGYFARVRLPPLLAGAGSGRVRVLPPLGLDPRLPAVLHERIAEVATACEFPPQQTAAVLLAHGSRRDPASRMATRAIAARMMDRAGWHSVRVAFLDEPPSLAEALADISGPAVVLGLFIGEGLHGGCDVPELVAGLGRPDVRFAGNAGSLPQIADLITASVHGCLTRTSRMQQSHSSRRYTHSAANLM